MSKRFFNSITHGEYEYAAQVIELNNELFNRTADDITRIINTVNIDELQGRDLEIYQTYVHEMTHFLDSTTTLWGLEFTCRMYRWFKHKTDEALRVVALNDAEITMHKQLINKSNHSLHFDCIKFSLEYNENVGMYVHLHYLNRLNTPLQSVPLSMLSLFEGHAYAQEKLIACKRHEQHDDLVSLKLLESEIRNQIERIDSSEYTCILALAMQLLPTVKLSRKLELICVISNFCLNIPSMYIAKTPEYILRAVFSGAPIEYISSLKMELSRSSNRSVLALVVLVSVFMQVEADRSKLNSLSLPAIEDLILQIFVSYGQSSAELRELIQRIWAVEFEFYSEKCIEVGADLALIMAKQKVKQGWNMSSLTSYLLPNILLSSGEQISPDNSINVDMQKHFDDILENSMSLEAALNNYGVKREHLSPEFHHGWLNHIKTVGTGLYVHDIKNEL
ncbi:hypothetical protein QPB17_001609 [Vibrio cholerae]|uniref:hypothetical protein n=1 Tax=Vibrio cholerae TaxID=666 RepID=UPI0011EFFA0E|nr:hypothetical protein [Vibrio cholerae]EHP3506775.1 hypothetical protein [Vibrio cholerae]EJL6965535.1 hypothetical protein [Vibrio cholerae]EKF9598965.1 hypothetical protein [Vibrio cholerae]EKG0032614.1 hypothetical protein [Vibrio cholerae]ELP4886724.1 hypothetical protein [Vibrio cholerae]